MTDAETKAAAIYSANVRYTRAEFAKQADALALDYLNGRVSLADYDQGRDRIRSELAYYLDAEADLFRLNRDHPLPAAA